MRPALVLLVASFVLAGCGSFAGPTEDHVSYAAMQALNPGVDGEWVLSEFPFARNVRRRPDGSLMSAGYWVEDPLGKSRPLMLHFDAGGILESKQYGGPNVRPPERQAGEAPFGN
ncbi:MAG: hypothetical protein O2894_01770 [Planctomycetota bacterium]|nr:hypothetical protein [Planctomycetota bacterium]